MTKWAIIVNRDEKESLYPAFILASSAAASGDDVIMFFEPFAAPALKKGVLEGMEGKGMPSMEDMVDGLTAMDGRIMMCELAFEAMDMKEEDLRDDVEIVGVTTFVVEAQDAQMTFSF
jgi:predicted peroxiredoxin